MSTSEAALLQRARILIQQRRDIDRIIARGSSKWRDLRQRRAEIMAEMHKIPTWILELASGDALKQALATAAKHPENDGAGRLIRWAEARYGWPEHIVPRAEVRS